ncbi:MAG: hypothetical protein Q8N88_04850, partial [Nanoarchaeota archaeon]|nr:hypothetical protein [Nanoarchaeota archaeon]
MVKISSEEHKEIIRIVSEEIESYKKGETLQLTGVEKLAEEYGVTPFVIRYHLKTILEEYKKYRKTYFVGRKGKLSKEKQKEIVNRVLEENILHRLGKINVITNTQKLAEKYGVNYANIMYYLKDIPEEDKAYRRKIICGRTKISEEKHKGLVDKINEEIMLHREGKISTLTSTKHIAKEYNVTIKCIGMHVKNIPEEDRKYRTFVLQSQVQSKPRKTKKVLDSDLSKTRESLGFTREEASALIGISKSHYYKIELEEQFPGIVIQRKIINFY